MFALSIVMFFFFWREEIEFYSAVLYSNDDLAFWVYMPSINYIIWPMNALMSLFSMRVQHIPILLQKCPSKIMHQESVISFNLDLLHPKILQLENVQILEFSIFAFPPPIFGWGGAIFHMFFFRKTWSFGQVTQLTHQRGETATEEPPPFRTPPVEACGLTSCEPFGTRAWRWLRWI